MTFAAQLTRMTALEALRSRLAWVAILVAAAAFGAAQFLSKVALIEADQFQAALAAALLRASGAFLIATFVIASMVREAHDKVAELLLSQAAPRWSYLLAKLAGYCLVACAVAVVFAVPLLPLVAFMNLASWVASFACELFIVASVSLFCVLSLTQVLPAFAATAGFYLLARSIDAIRAIATGPLIEGSGWIDAAVNVIVKAVAFVMPGLDRFALSRWLIDSPPSGADMGAMLLQTALYLALIASASLFDLYRKSY